jgi:hypothetical protein
MKSQIAIDYEALICEIRRYLAAVDAFRAAGYSPTWLPEPAPTSAGAQVPRARGGARRAPA